MHYNEWHATVFTRNMSQSLAVMHWGLWRFMQGFRCTAYRFKGTSLLCQYQPGAKLAKKGISSVFLTAYSVLIDSWLGTYMFPPNPF